MSRKNNDIFSNQEDQDTPMSHPKKEVNYQQSNENIEWSVPVETVPLPSRGAIYDKDSFFYNKETIDIKSMTAKEEDILLSAAYHKKGTVMSELIKSCIGVPGVDPDELLVGDRNALMISVRITGYGSDYVNNVRCPECNRAQDFNFDLSNLGIKRLGAKPVHENKNMFEFILPVSNKKVLFKLTTIREDKENDKEDREIREKLGENYSGLATSTLYKSIISVENVTDKGKIRNFINNMPARDSKALRDYIVSIQPGIDTSIDFKCKYCNCSTPVRLPLGGNFFFPD